MSLKTNKDAGFWYEVRRFFRAALSRGPAETTRREARPPVSANGETPGTRTVDVLGDSTIAQFHRPQSTGDHSLTVGQVVAGRFEILQFLNSGGMGEVYEAWDPELRERIALKTIRPEIAANPSVIERFKREVKQARGISQENVCRVYEVFSHTEPSGDRIWFLTMELLNGETLSERLRKNGPFPIKQALELTKQMVAGLAAAHDHGIVHRDFKSSNVMLVDPGGDDKTRVVITDFGLALNISKPAHSLFEAPAGGTGTPQYMAPEQEVDGPVGLAADQYALGVVVCEMLTGKLPTRPDQMGIVRLPPVRIDPHWDAAIRRCLRVKPEDRFKDIRGVLSAVQPQSRAKVWIAGVSSAVALAVIAAVLFRLATAGPSVENVTQLTPDTDLTSRPSLSREGQLIAYSSDRAEAGNLDIWVQRLPSGPPQRLTSSAAQDVDPNLAPDGNSVVFRSEREGGGIYLIKVAGGSEHLLAPAGRNPRFSPDGSSIVYWTGDPDQTLGSGKLFLLSLADGSIKPLATDFKDARSPVWSSDGRYILFSGCRGGQSLPACSDWWVTNRDGTKVENTGSLARLRRLDLQPIEEVGSWYRDMAIFSARRGTAIDLWALTISPTNLRALGEPRQLTSGDSREVAPAVAENGTIAFEHLNAALHIWRIANGSGETAQATMHKLTQDAAPDLTPYISRNGRWLVFSRGSASPHDLWIKDMQSGAESLFWGSSYDKLSPIIDDAGRTAVFEELDGGVPSVFAGTRGQTPKKLCTGCSKPTGWLIEDESVFYTDGLPSKIKVSELATGASRVALERDGYSLGDATWSPNTEYLLFTASRGGNAKQIFAVSFPRTTQSPVGQWIPISAETEFSERPKWSNDGSTVFYLSTRDGFSCIWGQRFDPPSGKPVAAAFPVMHYHNPRFSPGGVVDRSFDLSVSGESIYLNVAEINTSVWTGVLKRRDLSSLWDWRH